MPDLESAMAGNGPFAQGDTGVDTLVLTSSNTGYAPTSGTRTASVQLPRGFTATAISGTGWTCTLGTVSCVRSDALAAGASDPPVTVTLSVAGDAPSDARFIGRVAGGGELNDANDSTYVLEYIALKQDMTVAISQVGAFTAGGTGRYTITASNSGAQPTDGSPVTVHVTVPSSLTVDAFGGNGWTCSTSTMSCTRSDVLGAGSDYPAISMFVDIASNAPSSVVVTATVSGGGEVNTANDSVSITTPVAPASPAPSQAQDVAAPTAAGGKREPVLQTVSSASVPTLRANGPLGVMLSCASRFTVQAKLVLSRTSARRLHL
jgi:uncharacterized repeat protein (TIGR01451 family)